MIIQSNSIERFISELLIFVKLFLKINNTFFEARYYGRIMCVLCFETTQHDLVQANLFTEFGCGTQ